MSDIMGKLRDEIIESEKARMDFLKWKIILIAGLGAVGLGVAKESNPIPAVLGLIPLVCAYVDVVCVHNDLRILTIGSFVQNSAQAADEGDKIAIAYETACDRKRSIFPLEDLALLGTTVVSSALVLWIALFPSLLNELTGLQKTALNSHMHWCLIVAAVIGVLVSGIVKIFKWRRTKPQQQRPSLEAAVSQLVELYHNGKQDHVLLVMDLATHLKANPKIDIAQLRTENWLKSH